MSSWTPQTLDVESISWRAVCIKQRPSGVRSLDAWALYEESRFRGVIGWVWLQKRSSWQASVLTGPQTGEWELNNEPWSKLDDLYAWVENQLGIHGKGPHEGLFWKPFQSHLFVDSTLCQWGRQLPEWPKTKPWLDLDWGRTDKFYWRRVCQRIRSDVPARIAVVMCRAVEQRRYEERCAAAHWNWLNVYDDATVNWLNEEIEAAKKRNRDPCIDNERAADWSKRSHQRHYRKQAAGGCCGSHDEFVTHPDGRVFRIGFNYGH